MNPAISATRAAPPPLAVPRAESVTNAQLAHIPAHRGLPVVGSLPEIAWDPLAFAQRMLAKHGRIYRFHASGRWNVQAIGPEANEAVLFDREGNFSGEGWRPVFDRFFPQSTMMLDGEPHRNARRVLGTALKPAYMAEYRTMIDAEARRFADRMAGTTLDFYSAARHLTLGMAVATFIGSEFNDDGGKTRAFDHLMRALGSPFATPLAPTIARGLAARKLLETMLAAEVETRVASDGTDIFTRICRESVATGEISAEAAIGQIIFLLSAAHDTLASISTSAVHFLGREPEWQARLRDELLAADLTGESPDATPLTDAFIYEALRLHPPAPIMWRQAVRDIELLGHHIPAGTAVSTNPLTSHRLSEYFPDPERFDPHRFLGDLAKRRNRFAYVAFGGGAHMCLGLHFAMMEMRLLLRALLAKGSIACDARPVRWYAWPTWRPVTPLRATLVP